MGLELNPLIGFRPLCLYSLPGPGCGRFGVVAMGPWNARG